MTPETTSHARAGDLAQLVGIKHKHYIQRLKPGRRLETHLGYIEHDRLIGLPWGSRVETHMGKTFHLLEPSLADLLIQTPRKTQVMYPKDIGFILVTMGIGPGKRVLEAGTGSGSLATAFAFAVGDTGEVVSYERNPDAREQAIRNLERLELDHRVTFKLGNAEAGFDEKEMDAVFLDMQNPDTVIPQARAALKLGGFFGAILPTANQVSRLLYALEENEFAFVEVCEILLRYWRPVPTRFRPADRMIAHTGYLIFARPVADPPPMYTTPKKARKDK